MFTEASLFFFLKQIVLEKLVSPAWSLLEQVLRLDRAQAKSNGRAALEVHAPGPGGESSESSCRAAVLPCCRARVEKRDMAP